MSTNRPPQHVLLTNQRMVDALRPFVMSSVTPIGRYVDGGILQHATGTFLQVANRQFLVTAAHIWRLQERDLDLCVFVPDGREEHGIRMRDVPLNGQLSRALEPADVSVLELSEDTAAQLT